MFAAENRIKTREPSSKTSINLKGENMVWVIKYNKSQFQEKKMHTLEECLPSKDKSNIWITIHSYKRESMEKIGKYFNLHPLVVRDIVNKKQRPKIEDFGDYIFMVLKVPHYDSKKAIIQMEQISIVLGKNCLVLFQESEEDIFSDIRERLKNAKSRIRGLGVDYLAYVLIDTIIDNYFLVMEKIEKRVEEIEEGLIINPTSKTLRAIHYIKRELIFLHRSVWPLREVIGGLEKGGSPLIERNTEVYFRDAYEHTIQVIETIETFREMTTAMLDIYLSGVSNKLNEIMKLLTIIGTIFIPLTFITGIYGMNFRYMPEIYWRWGYPAILLVMLITGISMLIYFKRKKWL